MDDATLDVRLREFAEVDSRKRDLERDLKDAKELLSRLERDLLVAMVEERDIERISVRGIGTVFTRTDTYPEVTDDSAMRESLRASGNGDLIREQVHWQSLRSLVIERMEAGEPLPEGVTAKTVQRIQIRR